MARAVMWLAKDKVQIVLNTILGMLFLALIPVALITGLKKSVPFLVFLSLWALVAAHWSGALAAWAAQRIEEVTPTEETGEGDSAEAMEVDTD